MPNVVAYLSYVVLTTFTPGPNNIMSMSNGTRHGFRRTLPFTLGIFTGFFVMMTLACAFSLTLVNLIPGIRPYLTAIGAVYILWLAYKTVTAKSHAADGPAGASSFAAGVGLQFVNPKSILYGLTAASTFLVPYYRSWIVLALFCLFMATVSFVSTSAWAAFGAAFERFLGRYHRAVGIVMGLALVYCAVSLFH